MPIWSIEIKEFERLYESLKGRYPELEKETEQLIRTEDANVVMLYSRRCLEVIITDLCECELKRPRKTEPLKGIIDKLSHEEKIPSHIVASMQSLNSLSTFGTHPKEFDPEQVRPVLNNLTTIIKWYLKYKDSQAISKPLTEEAKDEMKGKDEPSKQIQKSKKRLIILLSGLTLVIVIVVVALFVFNIIGERERAEDLTKLEKSIAVLPFENLSNDEEQAWFSDGITDVIISQLSKISDLRVLGRTSTLKYKEIEEKKSISEIGDELGVNFIIEGTVQRQENKMRISVQLIRTLNEGHIWSDIYDREWKDIFDIQSDIAQRIAGELKTALTPEVKEQIEKSQTKNPEAYNLYLQGRFSGVKGQKKGSKKALNILKKHWLLILIML
jgi:TolB-like protein